MDPGIPRRTVELGLSPGHTWLTASNPAVAWFVRETISAAGGAYGSARQGGRLIEEIIDVGVGEAARAACEALARMGVEFRWHMDQDPRAGEDWHHRLPGVQ
jgi:hypothetical protein